MDGLNEDMSIAGVTVKDESDGLSWKKSSLLWRPLKNNSLSLETLDSLALKVIKSTFNLNLILEDIC